ncbi:MAG: penicillin acylase family protein, partial [Bacteroidota bacterium]
EKQETRADIITAAFQQTISELEAQLGNNMTDWHWEKVHKIVHPHTLGRVPSLAPYFNVGPIPINGSMEVINNLNFKLNGEGEYTVTSGPAKRRIVDFSDLDHSISVLPSGQSGNVMSPHYDDQAQLFADGKFRLQKMNAEEIKGEGSRLLVMEPK